MMRIEPGAGQPTAPIQTTVKRTDRSAPSGAGSAGANGVGTDTVTATAARISPEFGRLQLINDRRNRVASEIRQDGRQLDQAGRLLGQMQQQLSQITKIYPPYPLDEPERIKFLRSFNGLRQQIDSLTVPPPNKWDGMTMGVAADQATNDAPRQEAAVRPPAPQTAGPFGIPALSERASDQEVAATVELIARAQAEVAGQQTGLQTQAERIGQAGEKEAKIAEFGKKVPEWDFTLPGHKAAEEKSVEVRRELTTNASFTLTGDRAALEAAAG